MSSAAYGIFLEISDWGSVWSVSCYSPWYWLYPQWLFLGANIKIQISYLLLFLYDY